METDMAHTDWSQLWSTGRSDRVASLLSLSHSVTMTMCYPTFLPPPTHSYVRPVLTHVLCRVLHGSWADSRWWWRRWWIGVMDRPQPSGYCDMLRPIGPRRGHGGSDPTHSLDMPIYVDRYRIRTDAYTEYRTRRVRGLR